MNEARRNLTERAIAAPLPRDATVSFEFFPPKTEKMERILWDSVQRLAPVGARLRLGHIRCRRLHP